jgi:predicted oxidoreductase
MQRAVLAPDLSLSRIVHGMWRLADDPDRVAVAIAWLMAHPAWIAPVMGTNTLSRIAALSDACKVSLSREDWFDLYTEATGAEVP